MFNPMSVLWVSVVFVVGKCGSVSAIIAAAGRSLVMLTRRALPSVPMSGVVSGCVCIVVWMVGIMVCVVSCVLARAFAKVKKVSPKKRMPYGRFLSGFLMLVWLFECVR